MGYFSRKAEVNRKRKQLEWSIRISELIGPKCIKGIARQRMLARLKILQKQRSK